MDNLKYLDIVYPIRSKLFQKYLIDIYTDVTKCSREMLLFIININKLINSNKNADIKSLYVNICIKTIYNMNNYTSNCFGSIKKYHMYDDCFITPKDNIIFTYMICIHVLNLNIEKRITSINSPKSLSNMTKKYALDWYNDTGYNLFNGAPKYANELLQIYKKNNIILKSYIYNVHESLEEMMNDPYFIISNKLIKYIKFDLNTKLDIRIYNSTITECENCKHILDYIENEFHRYTGFRYIHRDALGFSLPLNFS